LTAATITAGAFVYVLACVATHNCEATVAATSEASFTVIADLRTTTIVGVALIDI